MTNYLFATVLLLPIILAYILAEIPNIMNPKRPILKHNIIKLSNLKIRNLKSGKRKTTYYAEGNSHETISAFFQQKLCRPEGSGMIYY